MPCEHKQIPVIKEGLYLQKESCVAAFDSNNRETRVYVLFGSLQKDIARKGCKFNLETFFAIGGIHIELVMVILIILTILNRMDKMS